MELYIHIPFCKQKCRYCSFTSYAAKENEYAAYIDLLLKEAESRVHEMAEPVRSVYIGGGTPSLISPELFRKLTDGLNAVFGFDHVIEFSSEANPGLFVIYVINVSCKTSFVSCSFFRITKHIL